MGCWAAVAVRLLTSPKPRHGLSSSGPVFFTTFSTVRTVPTFPTLIIPSFLSGMVKLRSPHSSFHPSWRMFSNTCTGTAPPKGIEENKDTITLLPPLDGCATQTAFDYFNNRYFFEDAFSHDHYIQKNSRMNEDKKKVLLVSLDEFFQTAWGKEQKDGLVVAMNFLHDHINGCKGDAIFEAYFVWKINIQWYRWYQSRFGSESPPSGQSGRSD